MSRSRPFGYWRDPVCLVSALAYACARWGIPATLLPAWSRGHVTDLLLVPLGLPWWLWLERTLGWRHHDGMPRWSELAFVLVVWTVAAEVLAPPLFPWATRDVWDVVAYVSGAAVAGVSWQRQA
ncbi:MAG: hypothetical protein AB7G23_11545 [Vicinamibacterales bacterium]